MASVMWHIEDDDGQVCSFDVPNSAIVPSAPYNILLPQHWAQEANNDFPLCHGTMCAQYEDCCKLYWDQCQHVQTIKLDKRTNIPKLRSAPGTIHYRVTTAILGDCHNLLDAEHVAFQAHVVSDDEKKSDNDD
eukprot:9593133-Ditylum_brightwellii.AAC.1